MSGQGVRMEDHKRGFSLRQKKSSARRPAISTPRQISNSENPVPPTSINEAPRTNGVIEKFRDANKQRPSRGGGNASDLVKRRYSTRFAQLPDFSNADAPPIPTVPSLTSQNFKQDPQTGGRAPNINVDLAALKNPDLNAEAYTTSALSEASDQQLRDYQSNLRKLKNRASTDLQQNVYQNRTQFIKISKEAEKLREEMRTLRGLMSELTASLNNASSSLSLPEPRTALDDGTSRARKQANRSSVANLEAMWNVQLHTLWKSVEGSQKFLPAVPGRHVVHEQDHWVELDSATWKPRRGVRIFLLNDHLMIALKKKNKLDANAANSEGNQKSSVKLVVDKCWPLQDVDLVDLAPTTPNVRDKNEMPNAINIRCGNESFTYRSSERDQKTDKAALLLAFKRTVDEHRRTLKAESENASKQMEETIDHYNKRDRSTSKRADLLGTLSNSKDRSECFMDMDGKEKTLRWVESQFDELDIEIALQRFEDAVQYVERLRRLARSLKGNAIVQDLITTKVDERAYTLADLVLQRLVDTHSYSSATQKNTAWLVRLGFDNRAREAFLKARSYNITKRSRQCIFEGDLRDYIFQLSFVYFKLIKNTVSIYQLCFTPAMMSACVKWAKEQLDSFNLILSRQLSSVQYGSPTWNECMDQAREHAAMMSEVGLDFENLVKVEEGKQT